MKHYLTLFFVLVTTLSFAAYPVGSRENIDGSVLGWDESNKCWRPIAVDANGQMKGTSTGDVVIASISVDTSKIEGYLKEGSAIHDNISNAADNTENILKIFNGESTDNNIVNDIKTAVGEGTTATDTVIGRLKNIEEKLGESSSGASLDIGNTATDTEKIREILKSDSDSGITESIARILTDIKEATEDVYADTIAIDTSSFTPLSDSDLAYASLDNASFKALAGSSSVVNSKTKRMFIEIRMPSDTDEFEISFNGTVYRPVKGRVLLEIRNDNLWIRVDTSKVEKVYITEGWK